MASAVDFAWGRPGAPALKAAGVAGVLRYLSADPSKALGPGEWAEYRAARIPVALVYEDGPTDFECGVQAGREKAQIAGPLLAGLAWPAGRPVYAAVDCNLPGAGYPLTYAGITAFATALGRPSAVYGPRPFLAYCAERGVQFLWELGSSSFNTGPEPKGKVLQQLVGGPPIGGAEVDYDTVLAKDWGQVPAPVGLMRHLAEKVLRRSPIASARIESSAPVLIPHPGGGMALCYLDRHLWMGVPSPADLERLESVGVRHGGVDASFFATSKQIPW
ncbi:MAG: glycoside hydrolase domain-containing protein [Acidimicrobiales bacterium]